jgi:hypothetical protein
MTPVTTSNVLRLCGQGVRWFMLLAALGLGGVFGAHAAPLPLAPTNTVPGAPEIPKSVFTVPSSPQEGRDPFFPNSMRLYAMPATGTATNAAPAATTLVLSGISQGGHRLAIINNLPFEVGEAKEVLVPGGRAKIRCVEIRADSVLVEVGGEVRELRLPAKRVLEQK